MIRNVSSVLARRAQARTLLLIAALLTGQPSPARADGWETGWYASLGAIVPMTRAQASDFAAAGEHLRLERSDVTFPRLAVGRVARGRSLELAYEKWATWRYSTADGVAAGNTHSNALVLAAGSPLVRWHGLELSGAGGVALVRTVATLPAGGPDPALVGGRNVWQLRPHLELGTGVALGRRARLRMRYRPLNLPLGARGVSGRSILRTLGFDVVVGAGGARTSAGAPR